MTPESESVLRLVRLKENRKVFSTVGEKIWVSDNVANCDRLVRGSLHCGQLRVLVFSESVVVLVSYCLGHKKPPWEGCADYLDCFAESFPALPTFGIARLIPAFP